MSNAYNRTGFEESILSSEDDFEPYGYASPELAPAAGAGAYARLGPFEREIEAAVLRRIEVYPGC